MNNLVKFSDGDNSDFTATTNLVTIEPVDNGYVVYTTSDDDEVGDTKQVFEYSNRGEMMKYLREVLGV